MADFELSNGLRQDDLPVNESAEQTDFFAHLKPENRPVTCLGQTFPNDAARRAHYTALLAEKLKDPAFRATEGFPLGKDEDILALSDPPYYCACPNPWLKDFVAAWEAEKPRREGRYEREPFAADVSEGKNDPIYNAHSYHTKVPHKAIMRYILHYTEPGDIVFDGFCGTGMTGVAAQLCGDVGVVRSLGYKVDEKTGEITDPSGDDPKKVFSHLGARHAVLNDLSPAASFIAYNYNTPIDVAAFERQAKKILAEVEKECGWMYETHHVDKDGKPILGVDGKPIMGKINYVVWSDVFVCPHCQKNVVFWDAAVNHESGQVLETFQCPHCRAEMTKHNSKKFFEQVFDSVLEKEVRIAKQVPVLINYSISDKRDHYQKKVDEFDLAVLSRIDSEGCRYWVPSERMIDGRESRRNDKFGITHVHQFFAKRNLHILSAIRARCATPVLKLWFNSQIINLSKLNRYRPGVSFPYNPLSGTFYIASQVCESDVFKAYRNKLKKLVEAFKLNSRKSVVSTMSTTESFEGQVDYLFWDPPFGANINYSELSSLWESWLKVMTNNHEEAIVNDVQGKDVGDYRRLMVACFKVAYEKLKPGHWFTVEFSNTSAAIWNSIQSALADAGFIVANVSALDKKQGSFKAVTTPTAVKQDLIISAYKPDAEFEQRFTQEATTEDGVWDFVRNHLAMLPVAKTKRVGEVTQILPVPERDPRILFDKVVEYYFRKGASIPVSAKEFQDGLAQRFDEVDGMFFLPEQKADYQRQKARATKIVQQELFVCNEETAIDWLRARLKDRPQTYQDVNPDFMQQLKTWNRYETQLELKTLLDENFLCYDGNGDVPGPIHGYLSTNFKDLRNLAADDPRLREKARDFWYVPDPRRSGEVEKLRERALLREFETYREARRLRSFRVEAVRAGFRKCSEAHDYATIIAVGKKLPEGVIEEDEKLLMYYDRAELHTED